MALRLEDLPPAMRAQAIAAGAPSKRARNNAGKGATRTDGRCQCGEHFTSSLLWERHSDETGHRRFELLQEAPLPEPIRTIDDPIRTSELTDRCGVVGDVQWRSDGKAIVTLPERDLDRAINVLARAHRCGDF